jgi:hypothetical protein
MTSRRKERGETFINIADDLLVESVCFCPIRNKNRNINNGKRPTTMRHEKQWDTQEVWHFQMKSVSPETGKIKTYALAVNSWLVIPSRATQPT